MQTIYDLDTPTLLVDLDRLERNIADMAQLTRTRGKAQRPHTKTHKTPEIARMQIEAGARGLTVAKLGEAEVMADAGFDDLLLANQIVGPQKVTRLLDLLRRVHIIVGVDSEEVAKPIGDAAQAAGLRAPVYIEADTGLGRAGTRSMEETLQLARFVCDHPGLEFAGVFTYEGHIYKAGDEAARREVATKTGAALHEIGAALAAQGTPSQEFSVGSTSGARLMAEQESVTEMRSGVYVFYDRMQMRYGATPEQCALTVLATVTSARPDGRIIIDAGMKSFASDAAPDGRFGQVIGHPELAFVGASEEHGHLQAEGATPLRVGAKVRIIPNHACTCVNMHDTLTAYRGEQVEAVWTIAARGKIR